MNDKIKLDFLVVGAAKAGTTTLYNYLKTHPDIYVPECKETLFFISDLYSNINEKEHRLEYVMENMVDNITDYKNIFQLSENDKVKGEVATQYLYRYKTAIPKIKEYLQNDVKIIIMLRNPIDRAYSTYTHLRKHLFSYYKNISFEDFLELENDKLDEFWDIMHYPLNAGLYKSSVEAYMNNFKHVKVILLDDLKRDFENVIMDVYNFLGVKQAQIKESRENYNISGIPRNAFLFDTLNSPGKFRNTMKRVLGNKPKAIIKKMIIFFNQKFLLKKNEKMKVETRNRLIDFFKKDIMELERILNRDLSDWYKDKTDEIL